MLQFNRPRPHVGFVVRTRNEERWVGHALQSIVDWFGADTPIIVVDNDSTDETLKVVELFNRRHFNVEVIQLDGKYTPGRALNQGITEVLTMTVDGVHPDTIGILSAHCVIRYIDTTVLIDHFADSNCFAVMGHQTPIYRGKKITPRYIWSNFNIDEEQILNPKEMLQDEARCFFHNAFSFIKADIWRSVPFPEDLNGKEDRYWANMLVDEDGKFFLDKRLKCDHYWTPNGATWNGIG